MHRPSLLRLIPAIASLLLAGGCVVAAGAPGAEPSLEDAESQQADLREQCTSSRRYDGRARSGRCASVTTPNGVWRARALTADAPDGICAYDFRGADGTFRAPLASDREALDRIAVAVANCRRLPPAPVKLRPIPWFEDPSHGGATGCDVCGIKEDHRRRAWVLLPRSVWHKRIEVRLASGETQAFELEEVPEEATTVRVELPAPPEGDAWLPGTVRVN